MLKRSLVLPLGVFSIGLSGCFPIVEPLPSARLRVIHASPDAPAVDVCSGDAVVFAGATFPGATGYAEVGPGEVPVNVIPADAGCDTTGVIVAMLDLGDGSDTTVAAIDVLDSIEPLVLPDDNTAPSNGMARVRFVHASPDAPTVDITLADGTTLFDDISFRGVGGYIEVPTGEYDFEVRDETGATTVLELSGVMLEAGDVYSVFAVGLLAGDPALDALITLDNG